MAQMPVLHTLKLQTIWRTFLQEAGIMLGPPPPPSPGEGGQAREGWSLQSLCRMHSNARGGGEGEGGVHDRSRSCYLSSQARVVEYAATRRDGGGGGGGGAPGRQTRSCCRACGASRGRRPGRRPRCRRPAPPGMPP